MSTVVSEGLMTHEEFMALPDDGTERMLIRGKLWEKPMTRRNRHHSRIEARIAGLFDRWLETQPEPRGEVFSGEAGCRLTDDPASMVGIDVCYVSAETAAREPEETSLIDGPPILAVEILSPSDKQEEIDAKLQEYLASGVQIVWIVNPVMETITVYRPDGKPQIFSGEDLIMESTHLPGFEVQTKSIFHR